MIEPSKHSLAKTAIAWLALLPAGIAGVILARVLFHIEPPGWLGPAEAALLLTLFAVSRFRPGIRPLGGYLLALAALKAGAIVIDAIEHGMAWRAWTAHASYAQFMFADSLLELIPCLLLALTVIGLGRRELFLVRGDLRARRPLPFGLPGLSWTVLGPALAVLFAGPLALQLMLKAPADPRLLGRALASLPLALAFAAFNAAQEEFRFRAVLLTRLVPVVGAGQALLLTSALFGIAHWFGHPSGASGVVMAGIAGYAWGRSMLDTRGYFWAWLIHGSLDVVIFLLVVMSGH